MGRVNDELRDAINQAVRATAHNTKLRLSVALSYGVGLYSC
jgi:undecaprenyl pyrophosphate synthase